MNQNAKITVAQAQRIIKMVKDLPAGGDGDELPTPFQSGYHLACEEIEARLLLAAKEQQ